MPFRERQRYSSARFVPVVEVEDKTLKNGDIVSESVDQCKKLPDSELFDLENQLEAGVDLDEVNSKVLQSKVVDGNAIVRKYTKRNEVSNDETSDN